MKTRFSTYDLVCSVTELQKYVGLRVNQVYDIDHKTYLIRLQKPDDKVVILLESGARIHTTDFEWPKNVAPSGFSMKLRKHLRNKRLESLKQLGFDRIVDLQFGTGQAAYHIFLELFDKGNIILTDCDLVILNILRPHTEGENIRFAVREKYPVDRARENCKPPSENELREILSSAKPGDNLKKVLNSNLEYGPAVLEHILLGVNLKSSFKIGQGFDTENDLPKLVSALTEAEQMMKDATNDCLKGFIIKKVEKRPAEDGTLEDFHINQEFHPFLFRQHAENTYTEYDSFLKAVDAFFSSLESQKIDMKAINQEKEALKKLENVKKDHDQRLSQLLKTQELDRVKAELITNNTALVERAILSVRTAIANQMAWTDIEALVKEGKAMGDPIASSIKKLKLDINHITLQLSDPYSDSSDAEDGGDSNKIKQKFMDVDIDLDLTAFANARKYYDQKRSAAKKQQKTIESQGKALKSAEKKTKRTLKEMKAIVNISKVRKTFWFEKFFWFISSENYLVIAGRDMMQNELIVKRYMRAGDIYVHADIHGASSVVIKNPTGEPVPPKTLNEAGIMAICYSVAWDAKVVTSAWWVNSDQVSKTAPSGEYLGAGSFMVRGKKNYLPPGNLIMGFSFLFKLEEDSVFRHKDERRIKSLDDDIKSVPFTTEEDVEIVLSDQEGDEEDDDVDEEDKKHEDNDETKLPTITEEETKENTPSVDSIFPDTEIKIHHSGKEVSIETKPILSKKNEEESEMIVFLGDQKPVVVKANNQKKKDKEKGRGGKGKKQEEAEAPKKSEVNNKEEGKLKRGQRGKLKKIKDKYKDEDEEDRQLRINILQNVVTKKSSKKEKNNSKEASKKAENSEAKPKPKQERQPKAKENGNSENDSDEEVQEPAVNTDLDMLSTLTGIPVAEDELLFAIPIVAPYNTLQNYKYKVKLTPGTGKRGKAARTAVDIFLKDKTATQRERELLKCVKDENLARNLPGKVKVSAPHLHKK